MCQLPACSAALFGLQEMLYDPWTGKLGSRGKCNHTFVRLLIFKGNNLLKICNTKRIVFSWWTTWTTESSRPCQSHSIGHQSWLRITSFGKTFIVLLGMSPPPHPDTLQFNQSYFTTLESATGWLWVARTIIYMQQTKLIWIRYFKGSIILCTWFKSSIVK